MKRSESGTRTIPVETAPSPGDLSATDFASLVALQRLAFGTVHTLNNAFTTVLGEASFLQGRSKGDTELEEACQLIRGEIDRCARLTRALLGLKSAALEIRSQAQDLGRIVRDLSGLLGDTLSRRFELHVETPDDLLLVHGSLSAIELLVILLVQEAADCVPSGPAELWIRAIEGGEGGCHEVAAELRTPELPAGSREGLGPPGDPHPVPAALALRGLAREHGATLDSARTTGGRTLTLRLPACRDGKR